MMEPVTWYRCWRVAHPRGTDTSWSQHELSNDPAFGGAFHRPPTYRLAPSLPWMSSAR